MAVDFEKRKNRLDQREMDFFSCFSRIAGGTVSLLIISRGVHPVLRKLLSA